MGVSGGPCIVRDSSLILELDAADKNSYVSGSTVWNDLSGNEYNGVLTNGPSFNSGSGGSISFDGIDDYLNIPNIPLVNYTTITIEMFVSSSFPNETMLWAAGALGPNWYIKSDVMGYNSLNSDVYGFSAAIMRNGWKSITATYSKGQNVSVNTVYVNGYQASISQQLGSPIIRSYSTGLRICSNYQGSFYFLEASIPAVRVYSRALSASEVLQNYNALKSRYNL